MKIDPARLALIAAVTRFRLEGPLRDEREQAAARKREERKEQRRLRAAQRRRELAEERRIAAEEAAALAAMPPADRLRHWLNYYSVRLPFRFNSEPGRTCIVYSINLANDFADIGALWGARWDTARALECGAIHIRPRDILPGGGVRVTLTMLARILADLGHAEFDMIAGPLPYFPRKT
jgi:hypothetical protein